MTRKELYQNILRKKSFLCVGLDTDIRKTPECLKGGSDPVFEFNKQIVDATADTCVAYKPNIAFYESLGAKGWDSLQRTVEYIRTYYPGQFIIADAKRGDIGNTAEMYARTFFDTYNFDATTLAPYMGRDSVEPFLQYQDKWSIVLALTSNPSSADFQMLNQQEDGKPLFEQVLRQSSQWGSANNTMYVVGATQANMLATIREIVPHHFLLIPGVGAQGGSLDEVVRYGMNSECGLLVNSSRAIIYADSSTKFAEAARVEAQKVQQQMAGYL